MRLPLVDGECKFPMTNTPQLTRNPAEFESTALRVIVVPRRNFGRSVGKLERARAILPVGRPDFSLCGSNMSNSDGVTNAGEISPRGRTKRGSALLVLAGGLLLFAAVVGTAFYWLRPTTLRIAVGPSGSSDLQLIQGLAQNFAQEGNTVRLSVVQTAGPVDSIKVLAAGNADLAVARTDEGMPDGTESVAILRKNVVLLWAAANPPKGAPRKGAKSKVKAISDLPGHRIGVVGRTDVNITLLHVILKESGVDPDKVEVVQFNPEQMGDMVRTPPSMPS